MVSCTGPVRDWACTPPLSGPPGRSQASPWPKQAAPEARRRRQRPVLPLRWLLALSARPAPVWRTVADWSKAPALGGRLFPYRPSQCGTIRPCAALAMQWRRPPGCRGQSGDNEDGRRPFYLYAHNATASVNHCKNGLWPAIMHPHNPLVLGSNPGGPTSNYPGQKRILTIRF